MARGNTMGKKMYVQNYEEMSGRFGLFCEVADDAEAEEIARQFDPPLTTEEWYLRDDDEHTHDLHVDD